MSHHELCMQSELLLKSKHFFITTCLLLFILSTCCIIANVFLLTVLLNTFTITRSIRYILVNICIIIIVYHLTCYLYYIPMVLPMLFQHNNTCALVIQLDVCVLMRSPLAVFNLGIAFSPIVLALERLVNTFCSAKVTQHSHIYILLFVWSIPIGLVANTIRTTYESATSELLPYCTISTTTSNVMLYAQMGSLIVLEVASIALLHVVNWRTTRVYYDSQKRCNQDLTTRIQLKRNMDATKAVLPIMYTLMLCYILDRCVRLTSKYFITDETMKFYIPIISGSSTMVFFAFLFPYFCLIRHPAIRSRARTLLPYFEQLLRWRDKVHAVRRVNDGDVYARHLQQLWKNVRM
jgi:hypothetical protein